MLADYTNILSTSPYPTLLALTTAIKEEMFPENYAHQLPVRNNVRISATNALATIACAVVETCRMVDLFALSWGGLEVPGAYVPGDPIHFHSSVMKAVVKCVLAEFNAGSLGHSNEKLGRLLPTLHY